MKTPSVKQFNITKKNQQIIEQKQPCENDNKPVQNYCTPHIIYDQISMNNFNLEQTLGQGAFALVKLATERLKSRKVAIKIYDKIKLHDQQKLNNLKREINILKQINHPNIIKLFYVTEGKNNVNLIMEYVSNQSLKKYITSQPKNRVTECIARQLFKQIISAIDYGHQKNIIHRDIKLDNILIDSQNIIKIIDYGFSIVMPKSKKLNIICGTPSYMAPELISKQHYNGFSADCWALGIVLYTMLVGKFPFKGTNERDLQKNIKLCKLQFPDYLSENAIDLIKNLLNINPVTRFNTIQALNSPWLQE